MAGQQSLERPVLWRTDRIGAGQQICSIPVPGDTGGMCGGKEHVQGVYS